MVKRKIKKQERKFSRKYIALILGIIILLFLTGVMADELYREVSIGIKTPKYSIENSNVNIKFYIWNNGNITLTGIAIYDSYGEGMSWKEKQQNITIYPNNYTIIETSIKPSYPGLYWTKIKIKDSEDRQIYQTQDSFNVHSYGETAAIVVAIITFLTFLMYPIFKKK